MSNLKIPEFLESLDALDDDDRDGLIVVCARLQEFLRNKHTTLNAVKAGFTPFRNAVSAIDKNHAALFYMGLSANEYDVIKKDERHKVSTRQRNLRTIDNVEDYIIFAESLLQNTSYIDNLLGLAALTGRRTGELLCTAEFEAIDDFNVMFTGQLKTKGRTDIKPYAIPLLSTVDVVIPALKRLQSGRTELKGNPTLAKNRTGKPISQKMKKLFPKFLGDNAQGRDLRRAYGAIAFYNSDRENEITKQKFISDVLGHSADDVSTGGSYMDFIVVDKK